MSDKVFYRCIGFAYLIPLPFLVFMIFASTTMLGFKILFVVLGAWSIWNAYVNFADSRTRDGSPRGRKG